MWENHKIGQIRGMAGDMVEAEGEKWCMRIIFQMIATNISWQLLSGSPNNGKSNGRTISLHNRTSCLMTGVREVAICKQHML